MAQQSSPPYHGLYINLDRSPERRRNMEEQLAAFGLQDIYARFPAVDGKTTPFPQSPLKPGEIGVFLSHRHALEQARTRAQCVHILEDDALLTPHLPSVIGDAVRMNLFDRYDFLFTDSIVNCHLGLMKSLRKDFDSIKFPESGRTFRLSDLKLIDLARVFFASFQSYVVGAKSIEKVIALYDQEIANGLKTPVTSSSNSRCLRANCARPAFFPSSPAAASKMSSRAPSPIKASAWDAPPRLSWRCCAICFSLDAIWTMRSGYSIPQLRDRESRPTGITR